MQQTTFENIWAKGEIAHNEQFLNLPQCFKLYSMIKLSFIEIYHIFNKKLSNLSAVDLSYVEKGKQSKFNIIYES